MGIVSFPKKNDQSAADSVSFDDAAVMADLIRKLRNANKMVKEAQDQAFETPTISTGGMLRVNEHLQDARKSIKAAVANCRT